MLYLIGWSIRKFGYREWDWIVLLLLVGFFVVRVKFVSIGGSWNFKVVWFLVIVWVLGILYGRDGSYLWVGNF